MSTAFGLGETMSCAVGSVMAVGGVSVAAVRKAVLGVRLAKLLSHCVADSGLVMVASSDGTETAG